MSANELRGTCPTCGHTLLASYDLERARTELTPERWHERPPSLWRYFELLPVSRSSAIVSLGEGGTPVVPLGRRPETGSADLFAKDDGLLPTGSFKARGMTVAVSRAVELGAPSLFVPSAGNAGVALAAYGARARRPVRVYLPERTPPKLTAACAEHGAEVVRVPGTIADAGRVGRAQEKTRGGFDLSTLREPYRVEGKKTMAFEIFEAFGTEGLPDSIVYPTGGGTGLVGMYKGFSELRALGWIDRLPKLLAVQAEGCAPVVRAMDEGATEVRAWESPATLAPGLLVPEPFSSERILEALRATGGSAVAVSDGALVRAMRALSSEYGLTPSPEAAAPFAALPELAERGVLAGGERVLLYLTGSGLPWSMQELEHASDGPASGPAAPRE